VDADVVAQAAAGPPVWVQRSRVARRRRLARDPDVVEVDVRIVDHRERGAAEQQRSAVGDVDLQLAVDDDPDAPADPSISRSTTVEVMLDAIARQLGSAPQPSCPVPRRRSRTTRTC